MPMVECYDPIKAFFKRSGLNSKSYADPIFHSNNTPCEAQVSMVNKIEHFKKKK